MRGPRTPGSRSRACLGHDGEHDSPRGGFFILADWRQTGDSDNCEGGSALGLGRLHFRRTRRHQREVMLWIFLQHPADLQGEAAMTSAAAVIREKSVACSRGGVDKH